MTGRKWDKESFLLVYTKRLYCFVANTWKCGYKFVTESKKRRQNFKMLYVYNTMIVFVVQKLTCFPPTLPDK